MREEDGELIQVDTDGNIKERVDSVGPYCVTEDHALLYTSFDDDEDEDEDKNEYGICIKKKTSRRIISFLETENSEDVEFSYQRSHFGITTYTFLARTLFSKLSRYD